MNFEDDLNNLINQNALKCGDLDVEVKDLRNKLNLSTSNLSTLTQNVTNLSGTVSGLSSSVSLIDGSVQTMNGSISSLSSSITSLSNNVEQVTLLYDKDSASSSLNLGYTAGIQSGTNVTINLSGYKYIKIYMSIFNYAVNNVGAPNTVILMSLNDVIYNYRLTSGKCILFANGGVQSAEFAYLIIYHTPSHTFSPYFYFDRSQQISSYYFVSKIEGVK